MLNSLCKRLLHTNQVIPWLKVAVTSGEARKYTIAKDIDTVSLFANKKVVLVGFPGAFTPTCTNHHLPQFVKLHGSFSNKGVEVIGLSINDPFVLKEFAQELDTTIPFICDGSGEFTKAIEAGVDLSEKNLGYRTRRFTALVENGTITLLNDENGGQLTDISSAETILKSL
ncbi:unnamed protein product [Blepharisma stoltei]|uniref:Thioredoxin domain-containing protein n=1 Tax=Blepharisma stoltei TaxID=1481888 RepID=A0AAU9ILA2_9CILI|nr:unnamed protein product [Blepharisma stoltei]